MPYNEIMVDIETTGTDASHAALIQLSAVAFNFESREIYPVLFDECLMVPTDRYWSEDTRDWWMSQPPHILDSIWGRMRDQRTVLTEFRSWALEASGEEAPVLWAKPISFEFPFLQSYFAKYDVDFPFAFWNSQDLRSWCRARGFPRLDKEVEFEGDAHNALHDTLHQLKTLFTLLERTDAT